MLKVWVEGFLFSATHHEVNVALIQKLRGPEFLHGKLTGIGGKMNKFETPHEAMVREFKEETGLLVPVWRRFCDYRVIGFGIVHMFEATCSVEYARQVKTQEEELVHWIDVKKASYYNIVPNLRWLLPMAMDRNITGSFVNSEASK